MNTPAIPHNGSPSSSIFSLSISDDPLGEYDIWAAFSCIRIDYTHAYSLCNITHRQLHSFLARACGLENLLSLFVHKIKNNEGRVHCTVTDVQYTTIKKIPTSFSFQGLHMIQHNGKINLVLKRAVLQLYCSLYRKVNRLLLSPMKYTGVVSYFGTFYRNRSM